jgi:hypothetical protein
MNLAERVKNMLLTPKTEWLAVEKETATLPSLLSGYVIPLALLAAAGSILKGLFFAGPYMVYGMRYFVVAAFVSFVSTIIAFYISAYVVDALAPSFSSQKDLGKSAQLVAYSSTPSYLAALLSFIPYIGGLIALGACIYAIYLNYLGLEPIKKTPEDKKVLYLIVAFIAMVVVYLVLAAVLGSLLLAVFGFDAFNRGFFL